MQVICSMSMSYQYPFQKASRACLTDRNVSDKLNDDEMG